MKIKQMTERLNSVPVRKKAKRLLAITLAVLMVNPVTDYGVSAHAQEAHTITAFSELSGKIASQQLAVGAEESDINLPDTLDVTISVNSTDTTDTAESIVKDSQAEGIPTEEVKPDESTPEEPAADESPADDSSVSGNDAEEPQEDETSAEDSSVSENDAEEPAVDETSAEDSSVSENDAEEPQDDENGVEDNTATDSQATVVLDSGEVPLVASTTGSAISADLGDADTEQTETEEIISEERMLTGITWQINSERSGSDTFDYANAGAVFYYEPVLPEGYTLADGVSLPQIQVKIEENVKWAFSQSTTIDGIEITVKAEKDVFPEGAVLHAKKVTSAEDTEKIEDAVSKEVYAEDTAKTVTELVSFDITITDADGNELQPDTSKGEVRVSFAQLPMVTEDIAPTQELKVFHMDDSLNEAEGLDTTVDEAAGTLEAPAEHFSVYSVMMVKAGAGTSYDISTGALTINSGNVSRYNNATITGTVSNTAEQLTIDGVTVNLTIEDLSITMTGYGGNMSGITLKNNATLNLTVKGTNALTGTFGGAGIDVPQGCTLNITADSTGTLTATGGGGYGGGAGIGAVGNQWSPEGYPTATQSVGTIHIAGGTILATGGSSYSYGTAVMGAAGIGGSPESTTGVISISGGTVTATGGYASAGIGGGNTGRVDSITITGGTVTATNGSYGSAIGSGYNGNTSDTLSCGKIAITGGDVTANGNIGYGGAAYSSNNVGGTVSIDARAAVKINNGVISPSAAGVNNYPISVTIYDGRLTSTIANAFLTIGGRTYQGSINVSEPYVGTLSCTLAVQGTLSGTQAATVSDGEYSWTGISCSETSGSYSGKIGEKLYPVSFWFYDSAITADITGTTVLVKRSGTSLNADSTGGIVQLVCDGTIVKQENGAGKMAAWMTAGSEMELFVTASGLNSGGAMSKSGQTVNASTDGTIIILHDIAGTVQLSDPLDLSSGSITFAESGGKLNVTYTPTEGGIATTAAGQDYVNEFEIIQSNNTATTNQIIFQNTTDFVKVKLNGVNMSSQGKAIDLQTSKVRLNLMGASTIDCGGEKSKAPSVYYMGIHAAEGSELTIDGNGSLTITNPSNFGVGVGGYFNFESNIIEGAGTIRIEGGTLTVYSKEGAGIGSSYSYKSNHPGTIYITGGTVNVYSSGQGAAIGGSYYAKLASVHISGGTVNASNNSKYGAVAIGGGRKGFMGGNIEISGGIVTASSQYAVAIGITGECPNITISGGTVTANSIGYETEGSDGSLAITGGTISTASGGKPSINVAATNGSGKSVYYTKADVNEIYGKSATITNASIKDYTYGFNDVKTDGSGILHLFLLASAESTKTTADFNGVTYEGTVTSTEPNILKPNITLQVSKGTVTSTSATLNVTADSGNTIYYVASDTALSEGSAVAGAAGVKSITMSDTTKTISLSNLTEETAYTYYLTAKEGGNYSDVVVVTFTTLLAAPNVSDVSVDYNGERLKADSGLGYTLEYALSANGASWTEVTTAGTSLTAVLNDHTGTEAISLYIRKNLSGVLSEAVSFAIPARPDCSVNTLSINYSNETVMIPSSILYQFATSVPASWDSAEAGTDSAVSLTDKISVAGTAEASLYKIYFRNPATSSSFVSKTASAVIPARPQTPASPSAASVADTSVTLTAVTGAEYSKDGTNWQDNTAFSPLAFNASQTFYQRIKATESSFASAFSSDTITTAKKSIAGATVTLTDYDSFTYDGKEKTPTVTVTLDGDTLSSSQYEVSYSNSNGGAGNHTSAGTVTVTVTPSSGGNYSGAVSQTEGMTYTIGKASLTVAAATTAGRKYNGTMQVSILGVTLSGIVPADNGKVNVDTSNLTGMLSTADAGTYNSVTLTTAMTLTGAAAGNYTLTQPTAPVSSLVQITKADALSLIGTATMVKHQANYKIELELTQISGYPVNPGAIPIFVVTSGNTYKGLASATVNAGGKLTFIADNTANDTTDTVTVSMNGMKNYTDSTITMTVDYTDKTPVTITGVTAQNGSYNGATHRGYTGTPSSSYIGAYEITYTGRNGTSYISATAPVNAGDYTVNFKVPDSHATYAGSVSISFEIAKATITAIADNKSMTTGGTHPSFTVRYTGIATGDAANSIFTTPATATTTADGKTAGSYVITASNPVLTTEAANNYTIGTVVNGTLTVSTPSSSNGSYSRGSTGGGSTTTPTTTPEKKPNQPVTAVVPVTATAGKNGAASASTPDKAVTDAIAKAQADAKAQGKTANGISVELDVIMPKGTASLTATFTRSSLDSLVSAGVSSLEINGTLVKVSLDKKALAEIQKQSSGNINIAIAPKTNLSEAAKKMIGTRPVYDITVGYGNGKNVSSFGGGIATVSIPYTLGKNEAVGGLYAVYVDAKGNATRIAGSAYDTNSGCVIFTTTHFSQYGIGYTAPTAKFTDISTHWAKESIDYVVGRGLLSGSSETAFSPNSAMTRGMLVTALGRLTGVDTKAYTGNTFTDVNADSAYRPYIEWAYSKGIIQGIGGSQFAPDRAITREEIAVIFTNYAKATGYTLPITREATTYADASSIGSAYKDAVKAMQQAGIMMGGSDNKFNPKGNATRAEVSSMLNRYIKLTINPDTAQGWTLNDAGQYLYYKDGKALTGTQTIDGVKYFFNTNGTLKTGWVKDGDNWRFYSGKTMLVGFWDLGVNGSNKTYYFTKDGLMVSGKWLEIDGKWYYFYTDGSLARSTKIDGYQVDEKGVRKAK